MDFINNDPKQITIRKAQNTLIVVGTGTILFGIWTAVRMFGRLFMLRDETVETMRRLAGETIAQFSDSDVFIITIIATVFFMLLFLCVRTFVGLSALAEGRGLRRRRLYLPIAAIMIISYFVSFFINFFTVTEENNLGVLMPQTTFSGLIIDLTSIIMLTEMIVSAIRIRKLNQSDGKAGGR